MRASNDWPRIDELLPHSGVARLVAQIVSASPTEIQAIGAVAARHPLAAAGQAPALLAIELGAQAAAAMETIGRLANSSGDLRPRTGSLVRVREARFACASLPVDTPLHVTAELAGSAAPLAIYNIVVTLDGTTVARAVISTHTGAIGGQS